MIVPRSYQHSSEWSPENHTWNINYSVFSPGWTKLCNMHWRSRKFELFFSGEWFHKPDFHRGILKGGFSRSTETRCIRGAYTAQKKWSFPLRISSVIGTKSAVSKSAKSLILNFIFCVVILNIHERDWRLTCVVAKQLINFLVAELIK